MLVIATKGSLRSPVAVLNLCYPAIAGSVVESACRFIPLQHEHRVYGVTPVDVICSERKTQIMESFYKVKESFIGTLNCRTLRTVERQEELAYKFCNSKLGVLAIQEHRIVHAPGEVIRITPAGSDCILLTSTAERNQIGASVGGVGIAMRAAAWKLITEKEVVSPRILKVTFAGNPRFTVVSVYSPTEGYSRDEVEKFHHDLRDCINTIPAHNLVVVAGDFNAKLGWSDSPSGWYYHESTSPNGLCLKETLREANLEVAKTRFQKRKCRLWTHLSDGTLSKSTKDYILVRKKWRNSIKDADISEIFSSLGSDHRAVTVRLKLTLRKRKTPPGRASYCYEELKSSPELQERFSVEVRNRFAVLDSAIANREDATERYGCLVEAVAQTSKVLLGKKRKRIKDVVAEDFRVKRARESVETASQQYHSTPSEETLEGIGSAKKDLEDAYQIVHSEILESKISKVEDATKHAKTRESWRLVNEISGRHQREQSQIEGDSADDRVEIWYNHFKTLLGTPAEPTTTDREPEIPVLHPPGPIDIGPFTRDELRTAKSRLKEARAFGDDSIPPEVLKRCDIDDIVLGFCNGALNGEGVPDQWRISNLVPVPKKGDLSKPGNYRGIALTSIVAKTLNRMILHRIRPHVETLLSNNQNGFREGGNGWKWWKWLYDGCCSDYATLPSHMASPKSLPSRLVHPDFD